jgi:hypothetical protein
MESDARRNLPNAVYLFFAISLSLRGAVAFHGAIQKRQSSGVNVFSSLMGINQNTSSILNGTALGELRPLADLKFSYPLFIIIRWKRDL